MKELNDILILLVISGLIGIFVIIGTFSPLIFEYFEIGLTLV